MSAVRSSTSTVAENRGREAVAVGVLSVPLVRGASSSEPSTLGEAWNIVSRTRSTDSLKGVDTQPPLAELLLTCMELGHSFSVKVDEGKRQFKCSCGESRVEDIPKQ